MAPRRVRPTLLAASLAATSLAVTSLAVMAITPAMAQQGQSKPIAQFGDWSVYASTSSPKVCYAISQPKTRLPAGLNRDPAYFFVSTRPGQSVKNEVSITFGFPLKDGSDAALTVGSLTLQLYTKDQGAWVRNVADEAKLVDAMRKGRDLSVEGTSTRGNKTTDKYSLSGIAQALDRVAQECK